MRVSDSRPITNLHTEADNELDARRFGRLWSRCGGRDSAAVFAALADYYREPHRHYHTGGHINDCLARMDLAAGALGQSDGVELAIWFHDVIYESGAPDNEQRSADWFAEQAGGALSAAQIHEVVGYIMSTVHCDEPVDAGARFVVDVDLSGLGMAPEFFYRDGENIRREFAFMNDQEFARGQTAFLQKLIDRERIYYTEFFYDLCEAQARKNIGEVLTRHATA